MPQPPDNAYEFDCPLCGGSFEASPEWLGQQVECPHCGEVVELPGAEDTEVPQPDPAPTAPARTAPPSQSPAPKRPPTPAPPVEPHQEPDPVPVRPMTREEREAARKRFNRILAVVSALILVIVFVVLANLTY